MSGREGPCHAMSCHVGPCRVASDRAMPCRAVLPRQAGPCCSVPHRVALCRTTSARFRPGPANVQRQRCSSQSLFAQTTQVTWRRGLGSAAPGGRKCVRLKKKSWQAWCFGSSWQMQSRQAACLPKRPIPVLTPVAVVGFTMHPQRRPCEDGHLVGQSLGAVIRARPECGVSGSTGCASRP